jgi:hypothetical protein
VIQVPPVNKLGIAVLSIDAPDTQSIHVISSQVACAPMDAIDCCDQLGCRKKAVYSTAVTAVQQALNLVKDVNTFISKQDLVELAGLFERQF